MTWTVDTSKADALLKRLDDEGGFTVATLGELKTMMGVNRLGKIVLADIRSWLERQQIGYFPKLTLENNDEPRAGQQVRLYRKERGSGLATVVAAVLDPDDAGDQVLAALLRDSGTQRAEEMEQRLERTKAAIEDALTEINRASE